MDVLKKPKHSKRSPSPSSNRKSKVNTGPGSSNRKRKHDEMSSKDRENGDSMGDSDLTRNMDAPQSQPHVEEVQVPKLSVKKETLNADYQPYRNGTLIDLDEDNHNSNEENKDPSMTNGHHVLNGGNGNSSMPFNNHTNTNHAKLNGGDQNADPEACEQTHHIIVPSYSAWFDYACVHEIEKRALPEFFTAKNKSKTPEIYIGYRNFMIDTYRLNPGEYLSVTACRRNLPGDVCAIMRVHAFLELWGLINYQVDYDARAVPLGPPCTSHFTVLADTPSGLAPITGPRPTTGPTAAKQMVDLGPSKNKVSKTASTDDKDTIKDDSSAPADKATPPVDVEKLNPEEFGLKGEKKQQAGGQTSGSASSAANAAAAIMRSSEWSDQELLLLLEGVEMYKDDWNKVCEHVGTRTQDECILKFLQLPTEDPYLDQAGGSGEKGKLAATLGPLAYQPIPFSQSGNPIMSTVAFLASVVDPRVASAAAKAAIAEFTKMKDEVPPQVMDSHVNSVVQAAKDGKKVDASSYNLEQTGIAIVTPESKSNAEKSTKENENSEKKTDESMEVDADSTVAKTAEGETKEEEKKDSGESTETAAKSKTPNQISEAEIKSAAASALAAAAVKARQLALNEEKKIKSTVSLLVETQLKKLEIKLRHFEELEAIMDRERENVSYLFPIQALKI